MGTRLVACLWLSAFLGATPAGDAHLLAGATQFRDGHFEQALVEFRVAGQLGARAEATWYVAASLQRLARTDEAVEAFAEAALLSPDGHDPLRDYYRALALYDARLYVGADEVLAALERSAGPKVKSQAQKIRGDLAVLFAGPATEVAVDWYLDRGAQASAKGRPALAQAHYAEAMALNARLPQPHREDEARAGLTKAQAQRVSTDRP